MLKLWKFKKVDRAISQSTLVSRPIPDGATLEQLCGELLELMAQESSNHHRMGQIYNHIVEKRLAEKAGYKDARDYLSKHLAELSQPTLTRYAAVASAFSEPVARRFGVTCLSVLLSYKEAADLEVNHEERWPLCTSAPPWSAAGALPRASMPFTRARVSAPQMRGPAHRQAHPKP